MISQLGKKKKSLYKVAIYLIAINLCFVSCYEVAIRSVKTYKNVAANKKIKKRAQKFIHKIQGGLTESLQLPLQLKGIPYADGKLLLNTKEVKVPGIKAPYNASMVANKEGYLLVFRNDRPHKEEIYRLQTASFSTHISCIQLDHNFEPLWDSSKDIDTGSIYSEDPRIVSFGDKLMLTYNEFLPHETYARIMKTAMVNPDTLQMEWSEELDASIGPIEKNWSPFVYQSRQNEEKLMFIYSINPMKIFEFHKGAAVNMIPTGGKLTNSLHNIEWTKKWGNPRGGTPAIKIGEQYLAFFHSFFMDDQRSAWYIMGAYTFDAHPPFKLRKISKYPILSKEMFKIQPAAFAPRTSKIEYPAGLVREKTANKDILHVSCGENDSGIRVFSFDTQELLNSLMSANYTFDEIAKLIEAQAPLE